MEESHSYEKLLGVSIAEIDLKKNECDIVIHDLKEQVVNAMNEINKLLNDIDGWKDQIRDLKNQSKVYKRILDLNLTGSVFSRDTIPPGVDFKELFRDPSFNPPNSPVDPRGNPGPVNLHSTESRARGSPDTRRLRDAIRSPANNEVPPEYLKKSAVKTPKKKN